MRRETGNKDNRGKSSENRESGEQRGRTGEEEEQSKKKREG